MSDKPRRDGRFVPYRKPPPAPPPTPERRAAAARLAACTRAVGEALQGLAMAMDVMPDGAITLRDEAGVVWELTIQQSDAPRLRCEMQEG